MPNDWNPFIEHIERVKENLADRICRLFAEQFLTDERLAQVVEEWSA